MVAWQLPDICWLDSVPWLPLGAFHWPMWAWNAAAFRRVYPCRDWCCTSSSFQADFNLPPNLLDAVCCQIGLWATVERLLELCGVLQP